MSEIEWCNKTINPIVGCSKASPACDNCYAERMAKRLQAMGTRGYEGVVNEKGNWVGKLNFIESELEKPARWKKPKRIFVGSMTDLFHENVKSEWIDRIVGMAKDNPIHTFIFLTKRAERMNKYFTDGSEYLELLDVRNIWIGVTAENQKQARRRIPILLDTPASKRFVSIEPILEHIDLNNLSVGDESYSHVKIYSSLACIKSTFTNFTTDNDSWHEEIVGLDWVIVGGESGHNARIANPKWVLNLKQQCEDSNVPFFFKQWGEFIEESQMTNKPSQMKGKTYSLMSDGELTFWRCGKKLAGKLIDGREYIELPKMEVI